jgi:hypothetical protein
MKKLYLLRNAHVFIGGKGEKKRRNDDDDDDDEAVTTIPLSLMRKKIARITRYNLVDFLSRFFSSSSYKCFNRMDVLELPRPVINFLRTMAKEGCRYVLSWDIFGGTDAVTLTLTWKLNDDQSPGEQIYDDLHIRHTDSPRRSRRDGNVSRPTRGKSLESHNQITNKPIVCHPSHVSTFEPSSMINRQKKESDPIYANLSHIKYDTNRSTSFLANNNLSLPIASTPQRPIKQQDDIPVIRKSTQTYSKLKRINHIATRNDDVDDDDDNHTLDPWVKRLDYSQEDDPIEKSTDDIDKTDVTTTSGKVKFKRKPDYF